MLLHLPIVFSLTCLVLGQRSGGRHYRVKSSSKLAHGPCYTRCPSLILSSNALSRVAPSQGVLLCRATLWPLARTPAILLRQSVSDSTCKQAATGGPGSRRLCSHHTSAGKSVHQTHSGTAYATLAQLFMSAHMYYSEAATSILSLKHIPLRSSTDPFVSCSLAVSNMIFSRLAACSGHCMLRASCSQKLALESRACYQGPHGQKHGLIAASSRWLICCLAATAACAVLCLQRCRASVPRHLQI